MKSIRIMTLCLILGFITLGATKADEQGCTYGNCSAYAKSTGERCKNCRQKNSYYCWTHNNEQK